MKLARYWQKQHIYPFGRRKSSFQNQMHQKVGAVVRSWAKYWFCHSVNSCLKNWMSHDNYFNFKLLSNFKTNETHSHLPIYGITFSGKCTFRLLGVTKRQVVIFIFGGKKCTELVSTADLNHALPLALPAVGSAVGSWAGEALRGLATTASSICRQSLSS